MSDRLASFERTARKAPALHQAIADSVPQIGRGMVWCRVCGRSERVDGALALRYGWPKCCGATMTIDAPPITP